MSLTSIFSRLAGSLFGGAPIDPGDTIDPAQLDDAVDAIVEAVEPRIRVVPRYRKKLAPSVTRTIRFLRSLAPALPDPIELSRAAWSADSYINAFFATAADVPAALGRSDALRAFFDDPANVRFEAAYALLGMRREERIVLASALIDGEVRRDVAQTTIGFATHNLFALAADPATMRRLVGEAILERVAGLVLERIVATRERATELDTRKSMLATRLRMLNLRRGGLRELAPGEPDPALEIAAIEKELAATVEDHLEVKASLATLDYSIDQIEQVFGDPQQYLGLDTIDVRVNRMGYKLETGSAEAGSDLRLHELWIGTNLRAVIAPVRIARAELPPPRDPFAQAGRRLI
jgi:hypothetical protein